MSAHSDYILQLISDAMPLHDCIPRILPNDWTFLQRFGDGGCYQNRNGLRVIASTGPQDDGRDWLHLSMSRVDRMPSYDDMKLVKNVFANERWGYQLFSPPSDHVNIHQFCLHIWVPLTGEPPIPNFGAGGSI